jgi:hypothetical protein
MARLVGVFNMAHSPFCYRAPEQWNEVRASRSLRADVPFDDVEVNRAKAARVQAAFATLRRELSAARPDVIVCFGDDQLECFDFSNFPAFAVYVGAEYEGKLATGGMRRVPGHPEMATALLAGLMRRGFDPAFSMDMPKPDRGIGHAVLRPAESLTDFTIPIVPVLINCYYAPQPTGMRCYGLGRAAREIITGAGYGPMFTHRTGHGIGLETHEEPYLVESNPDPLREGDAFSVEPGIYVEGRWGARIEDIVVCTATGGERLNQTSRDLRIVG